MSPVPEPAAKLNWADVDEDNEVDADALPAPETREEADGTRVTIEYKINEDGKKVKITRKTKLRLIKSQVNHAVAERKKNWKKFGEVAGVPAGPDANSTSHAEKVFLKLSSTIKDHDAAPVEDEADALKKILANAGKSKITCRICQGDHWTSKCPFKDTHQPLGDLAPVESTDSVADVAGDDKAGGKYVPPSLRNRGPGESMRGAERRDEFPTVRITNLSEDAQDQDVKDLVNRFGHTSRVFVSRDRETNLCKGLAFISFYHKEDAEKAIEKLNGFGYDNLILQVDWARSSRD
ncbi:eIF-3 RNA-binding subunit [Fimicolochytrium jonesii]|uniref:eIF-3 RNA-binding subunit n=1 Tax=Fimicolochytrium jonesii TaxID=1396493 RepID=UPI0022FDE0CF|nr:eIF-3 RNA-binding subunit [Fimicolochytrium jonesii]KAI8818392.1 eIF-3 RNA-binding subunit [Fimicolochytrium jonesii]